MAESTTPAKLLPLLMPYVDHKNPKLRGQAGTAVAAAAVRMQVNRTQLLALPATSLQIPSGGLHVHIVQRAAG